MGTKKKSILFLTSLNLVTNPRILKEIKLASGEHYIVNVIYFRLGNWSDDASMEIVKEFPQVNFNRLSATRSPFFFWFFTSLLERVCRLIYPVIKWLPLIAFGVSKRSFVLLKAIQSFKQPIDLIVAHNPATFYPAFIMSRSLGCPYIIDLEDYHPGESNGKKNNLMIKELQNYLIPRSNFITSSSPLILKEVETDIGQIKCSVIIPNVFNEADFYEPQAKTTERLKIIWFSQHISHGRGLEAFIPLIIKNKKHVELTLVGKLNDDFYRSYLIESPNVKILEPLPQKKLHESLADFDIGLALEPGKDLNNNLALSNKIYAYLQAGLYVIASSTPAQKKLIDQFPDQGLVTLLDPKHIEMSLQFIIENKFKIRQSARSRFLQNKKISWEIESKKVLETWNSLV